MLRELDSNQRPPGYEPDELPLLYPALFSSAKVQHFSDTTKLLRKKNQKKYLLHQPNEFLSIFVGWKKNTLFDMKIKQHIPNAITCLNLLSGTLAVMMAYEAHYQWVVFFVILSAVFDFFDGFSARLLGVSSAIGKELDSLADLISFGFAPALTAYSLLNSSDWDYTRYLALLIVAFSALRLAKFNLDTRQTTSFIGLATPANALFWVGLAYSYGGPLQLPLYPWAILLLIALSCFLLVCELPMFSLKFKSFGWKGNEIRWIFIGGVVLLSAIFRLRALPVIIVWYTLLSLCALIKK